MASYYWIKLYHEILDDPKMGRLSDRLWRRTVEMFLFAGKHEGDGCLPPIEDMAWSLRVTPEQLQSELDELERIGIIRQDDGAGPFVVHFEQRQAPVPDADRKRNERQRRRHEQYAGASQDTTQERHEPVTSRDTDLELDIENNREEKTCATDAPSADADTPVPTSPSTFQEWQAEIRETKNRPALLRRMCEVLYPGLDPPTFGRIGTVARKVGGAGRLADLLWQCTPHPPTGDLMSYIEGVAKNGNHRNRNKPEPEPVEVATGWEDE